MRCWLYIRRYREAVIFYTANSSHSRLIQMHPVQAWRRISRIATGQVLRHSQRRRRGVALLSLLLAGTLAYAIAPAASAATVAGLYDASVHVTDRSDAARQAAFGTALGVVAARVSGRQDAAAKLGAALGNAPRYVQRFSYDNGQLDVGFDSSGVNTLLEQAGLPLWGRERPATVVVFPDALQGLREARAAVEQTAKLRGVPLVWAAGETSEQFANATPAQLQVLANRYMAGGVLLARVTDPVSAASLKWQFAFNGALQEMPGAAEEGPNLAADVMGRYYAVASKESTTVVLEVAGMNDLGAYANTLNYLNALSMVRSVEVDSLQSDVARFRVGLRGNVDALKRAVDLDQRLLTQPSATADAAAVLSYRYNAGIKVAAPAEP